jgi:RNA polymerase sigma-70 factor (ECF subfamily)
MMESTFEGVYNRGRGAWPTVALQKRSQEQLGGPLLEMHPRQPLGSAIPCSEIRRMNRDASDRPEQSDREPMDDAAWGALLDQHRARLRRMLELRIQGPLRGRVDASDVIQDAYLDATRRRNEFLERQQVPLYVWLRGLTEQQFVTTQRRHLGAQGRDARREISLYQRDRDAATSAVLAAHLIGQFATPSSAAMLAEQKTHLAAALDTLEPNDREILVLRHFEELSTSETSAVLGLTIPATCNRYVRALARLRAKLSVAGGPSGNSSS